MNWQAIVVYLGLWSLGAFVGYSLGGFDKAIGVGLVALIIIGPLGLATVTDSLFRTILGTVLGGLVGFGLGTMAIYLYKALGWTGSGPLVLATVGCCLVHWALGPRVRVLDWLVLVTWIVVLGVGSSLSHPTSWTEGCTSVVSSAALMMLLPFLAGRLEKSKPTKNQEAMSFED